MICLENVEMQFKKKKYYQILIMNFLVQDSI